MIFSKLFIVFCILFAETFLLISTETPEPIGQIRIRDATKSLVGTTANTAASTSRTVSYTVYWSGEDLLPTTQNAFIGIRSLNIVSQVVDFTVEWGTATYLFDTGSVTYKITAGPNCNIQLVEHFVLMTADPRVILINYDFGSDPSFVSTFSTTTDAELTYTIPYTPVFPDLFTTGATAYVSFPRVKFAQTCTTYKFDYEIIQITSSSVQLKIRKFGNTVLEALQGQILVISSDAESSLGFKSTTITTSAFGAGTVGDLVTSTLTSTTGYYGAPEMMFTLKKFNFDNLMSFRTEGEVSIDSTDFKSTLAVTQVDTSIIQGLEYNILTFCKQGIDCKRPGFQPSVIAGEGKIQTFIGMSPGTATAAERAINFNIAFSRFLTSVPTNFAVGILGGDSTAGFGARVLGITASSIQIEIRAFANVAISKLKASYIASLWDGFQIIPTDFADSGQLAITNGAATRTFTQNVYYATSANIGSTPSAYTIFSEVDVATTGSTLRMDSSQLTPQTSVQPFYVPMQQTVTGTYVYNKLKGFVIVTDSSFRAANKIDLFPLSYPVGASPTSLKNIVSPTYYYVSVPIIFNFMKTFALPCGALKTGVNFCNNNYYVSGLNCKITWQLNTDNTCATSTTTQFSVFSFPSYATSGFDFSFIQGIARMCIEAVFTGGEEYAIVVTDDAEWNGIFAFNREIRTIPRVIQTLVPTVLTLGSLRSLKFTQPTVVGVSGFYTYNLIQTTTSSYWYMAGLTSDYMHGFGDASSLEVPETAIGTFGYSGADLSQSIDKYMTLIANQLIFHDQTTAFSCTVRVTFSGVIRSLYVDSKFILAGSSVDPTASTTLEGEVTADFVGNVATAKAPAIITIFGYYLKVTLLELVDCIDSSSTSVTPTFTPHIPAGSNAGSRMFYTAITSVTCGSGCLSCKDSSVCYECLDGYFLLGSTCVSSCNDPTYSIAVKDKYCRSEFANLGLRISPTTYSGNSITFDYRVNPFSDSYGALTIIYPKAITVIGYPLIMNDETKPFALVEGPSGITVTSLAVEQVFSISKTINVNNIASASNPQVRLITYTIYQDSFLFFTVLNSGPNFIGFQQNTAYGTAITSLSTSDNYQVHAIINAPSGGDLSIEFKGQLEVTLNQVTVIFSATFATQQAYTLERRLSTGLSYLTFKGTGTDYFDFSVSGAGIKIYSPISLLSEETLTLPVSSVTAIANCYNGDGSTCRSCLTSYYLDVDNSQCVSNCTNIDLENVDEERICKLPPPPVPAPEIPPVPKVIKVLQKVYQARQISNEVFSVISSVALQGMHSIRSQTLQSPLGYFMFINIKFPLNYIQYAANNQDSWDNSDNTKVEANDSDEQSNIDAYIGDQDIGANIGQTLIYLAACIVLIPTYEAIVWLAMKHKQARSEASQDRWYYKVLRKGSVSLRWSFLMNQFISKYQDVTFFVFLGIYNVGRGKNTSHGNTAACIIGFILVVFILLGLFFLLRNISKQFKNYKEVEIENEKFKENDYLYRTIILFKDLKKDKFISLLYTFFAILRIFGFCFSIIFIGNVVGIQLAFLNISSLFILFYLLYFNPFEEFKDLRLTLAYEIDFYVGVLAATILQIYISAGGDDSSTKSGFGWAIIVADIAMTILDYISFYLEIQEYAEIIYFYLKSTSEKIRNRKRRPISPEVQEEGESPNRMRDSDLKTDDASPEKKLFKFEQRDSAPSTPEILFASNIIDPNRPRWKDRIRQSPLGLEEQVFSIVEPKEENDNLMSFSGVKSPIDRNSKVDDVLSLSSANRNHRIKMKARKSHLSISSDKEMAEIKLNEDGEIAKLV